MNITIEYAEVLCSRLFFKEYDWNIICYLEHPVLRLEQPENFMQLRYVTNWLSEGIVCTDDCSVEASLVVIVEWHRAT